MKGYLFVAMIPFTMYAPNEEEAKRYVNGFLDGLTPPFNPGSYVFHCHPGERFSLDALESATGHAFRFDMPLNIFTPAELGDAIAAELERRAGG